MNDESKIVNAAKLAEEWGVCEREIYKLEKRGLCVKSGRGFDYVASFRRYVPHLRRLAAFRHVVPPLTDEQIRAVEQVALDEQLGRLAEKLIPLMAASSARKSGGE
jgi:hypothetical protein